MFANFDQGNGAAASNGNGKGKGNAKAAAQSNLHVTTDTTAVTEHLQFVYDAQGNLIAENDANGHVIREYIYLGSRRIAMTNASLDHPLVTPSQGPTGPLVLYFIHNDHLGTPRDVTDASQNVVWAMHQTPFGKATLDTEAIRMPMRFPGQYADIESGLNYNYHRDYDPTLGRYTESDPIGLNGGTATFAYAAQNPIIAIDLLGMDASLYPIDPIPADAFDHAGLKKCESAQQAGGSDSAQDPLTTADHIVVAVSTLLNTVRRSGAAMVLPAILPLQLEYPVMNVANITRAGKGIVLWDIAKTAHKYGRVAFGVSTVISALEIRRDIRARNYVGVTLSGLDIIYSGIGETKYGLIASVPYFATRFLVQTRTGRKGVGLLAHGACALNSGCNWYVR